MDLDRLKDETLKLIEEHNQEKKRKLTPVDGYGDTVINGKCKLFRALWNDDNKSSGQIGFLYDWEKLRPVWWKEPIDNVEDAITNFKKQLEEID